MAEASFTRQADSTSPYTDKQNQAEQFREEQDTMIKMSKGKLMGNVLFLTIGPYTAAQVGLRNPQLLWPTIFLMLGVRFAIYHFLLGRQKRPGQDALKLHALAVKGKAPADKLPVLASPAQPSNSP